MIRTSLAAALTTLALGNAAPVSVPVADGHAAGRNVEGIVVTRGSQAEITVSAAPGGLALVTARLTPGDGASQTVTLQMYDGDQAVVALPGHADTQFHFRRDGDRVLTRIDG